MSPPAIAALAALALAGSAGAAEGPRVVATIVPVHSLAAAIMEGAARPRLLVGAAASPHDYALRPSDAEALHRADAVFWIGPGLEGFLVKPLASLAAKARVVELSRVDGVTLLPRREGGAWEQDESDKDRGPGDVPDMHIWLDPANAQAMARAIARTLAQLDPANAPLYERNRDALVARLAALDREISTRVAALAGRPFVVFHDAYQYFERRYGLRALGSIAVSPERPPGPRRLRDLRAKISRLKARCVFREPQFEPGPVATLVAGTEARVGVLDPEGATLEPGPGAYDELMRRLGAALADCLAPRPQGR